MPVKVISLLISPKVMVEPVTVPVKVALEMETMPVTLIVPPRVEPDWETTAVNPPLRGGDVLFHVPFHVPATLIAADADEERVAETSLVPLQE